jgi:hypothetical protein
MDKTDIVHALNQHVEKLNIVLKTFKKTKNIGWWLCFFLELNVYIHEDVPGVTSCKLFHKKDNRWHNWSKLYYSWIKLTLITMYKSFFLLKWNKIQLWKLVCFIMQLRDRPFNLKGCYGFLFRSEFFFRTTQELEYYFFLLRKAQIFFPEFDISLYDKNSESDYYFFSSTKIRIFCSATLGIRIFF